MGAIRVACFVLFLSATSSFLATTVEADDDMQKWVDHYRTLHEQASAPTSSAGTLSTDSVGATTTAAASKGRTIIVDQSGKGNFRTVQEAINSVPKGNKLRIIIVVRPGVYREKILIPQQKPYIYLQGSGSRTVLVCGDTAAKAGGTSKSACTTILSDHFIASDITFANSAPAPVGGAVGRQAVALLISGDFGAFYRCSFYGAQDTLYDKKGRHYFRTCFIQGSIDFIFGDGQSLYHYCSINSIAKGTSGSVTAQNRLTNDFTGFSFLGCRIGGTGTIYLGRAWGTHSRVVFIRTYMANMILPAGWFNWNDPKREKTVFYAEYACTGPGSNRRGRVAWSRALTAREAAPFSGISFINGQYWLQGKISK